MHGFRPLDEARSSSQSAGRAWVLLSPSSHRRGWRGTRVAFTGDEAEMRTAERIPLSSLVFRFSMLAFQIVRLSMFAGRTVGIVSGLFFAATSLTFCASAQRNSAPTGAMATAIAHLPVTFEQNQGQSSTDVRYIARTGSSTTLIRSSGAAVILRPGRQAQGQRLHRPEMSQMIAMHLIGVNQRAAVSGQELEPEKSNYFVGSDPAKWQTDLPHYARVKIQGVYPHVDMLYYATEQQLEYDFVVSPLGDPKRLRMRFDGQDHLSIDRAGKLVLQAGKERLTLQTPTTYQTVHGQRKLVQAAFVQSGQHEVKIRVGSYDHALPLIIDPKLEYSSYLGGTDDEGIFGIGFDLEGNIYVAGETSSLNFPGAGVPQEKLGGDYDAFVSKFNRDGSRLLYSTYLGGSMYDHAVGLAVEPRGAVYVAGITSSPNFPVVNAIQPSLKGSSNAFITKLDPSGSRLTFSTYLGGSEDDGASGITLGRSGDVFVAGFTTSSDFPITPGSAQQVCDLGVHPGVCTGDGFLTKLKASGTALRYSTFLGGSSYDQISAVKVDRDDAAYVVGQTSSTDFPTRDAFQPALAGYANAFVAKVSPAGNSIEASSYLGGEGYDAAMDLALDNDPRHLCYGLHQFGELSDTTPDPGSACWSVGRVRRQDPRKELQAELRHVLRWRDGRHPVPHRCRRARRCFHRGLHVVDRLSVVSSDSG